MKGDFERIRAGKPHHQKTWGPPRDQRIWVCLQILPADCEMTSKGTVAVAALLGTRFPLCALGQVSLLLYAPGRG